MLTVPVSGHVCRTACDSRRISTQVRPAPGKACETAWTIVAPARSSAATKRSLDLGHRQFWKRLATGEIGRKRGGRGIRVHRPATIAG